MSWAKQLQMSSFFPLLLYSQHLELKCNANSNFLCMELLCTSNFFHEISILKDSPVDNNKETVANRNELLGLYDMFSYGTVLVQ